MARPTKKAAVNQGTAPDSGADAEVAETAELIPDSPQEESPVSEDSQVPVLEFAGAQVPTDSQFVTPVDRFIELDYNGSPVVFTFRAGEPRQLPAGVILEALGAGVQLAN